MGKFRVVAAVLVAGGLVFGAAGSAGAAVKSSGKSVTVLEKERQFVNEKER